MTLECLVPAQTLVSTSLPATCLELEHGEEEVFVQVMCCLYHWTCLGKGFINVSNVQPTHLWALSCVGVGAGVEVGMAVGTTAFVTYLGWFALA